MNPLANSFNRVNQPLLAWCTARLRVLGLLVLLGVQVSGNELPVAATPPARPTSSAYLYAGEQFDPDLGLYYNRARYLNPDTGRFWNMDTYEGEDEDPASLHKYLYANADPVNGLDPSGQFTLHQALTTVSGIATVASMHISTLRGALTQAFQVGGRQLGLLLREFGTYSQQTAYEVIKVAQRMAPRMRVSFDVSRGTREVDFALKLYEKVLDLEVKYKLPNRLGESMTRLVEQVRASIATGQATKTAVWTFKEPTMAELNLLYRELGPAAQNIQIVHGVTGLFQYLRLFFNLGQ